MSTDRFRKPRTFFTQVSNHAIDDENISPQAYYIYSKIQRYITLESEEFILNKAFILKKSNMTEKTFDKYWKELQHLGYLKTHQMPDTENKGQWITEYELLEQANTEEPYFSQYNIKGEIVRVFECPKIKDKSTSNPQSKKTRKSVKNKVLELQTTVPPKKGETVKASLGEVPPLNNTNYLSNTNLNNKSVSQSNTKDIAKETDRLDEKNMLAVKRLLQDAIHIEDLKQSFDAELVTEIELNIIEMYLQEKTTIKGEVKSRILIQGVLNKLTYSHIEDVIYRFTGINTKIKNSKAYLQTMIYNAPFETTASIKNEIKTVFGY